MTMGAAAPDLDKILASSHGEIEEDPASYVSIGLGAASSSSHYLTTECGSGNI
jgi:hypothetical protein